MHLTGKFRVLPLDVVRSMGSDDIRNLSFSSFVCWWHPQKACLEVVVRKATSASEREHLSRGSFRQPGWAQVLTPWRWGMESAPSCPEQAGSKGRREETAPTARVSSQRSFRNAPSHAMPSGEEARKSTCQNAGWGAGSRWSLLTPSSQS